MADWLKNPTFGLFSSSGSSPPASGSRGTASTTESEPLIMAGIDDVSLLDINTPSFSQINSIPVDGTMDTFSKDFQQLVSHDQNEEVRGCEPLFVESLSIETAAKNTEPYVGMPFESLDDAGKFYIAFAKENGFGVRIRTTKMSFKSKEVVTRTYVCCNEGQHATKTYDNENSINDEGKLKKRCSTLRNGCEAMLKVSRDKDLNKWFVKSFNNVHNHVMVSPKSLCYLRCHKKMSAAAKSLVEKFDEAGLPTGKVATLLGDQQFSERDCWNHLRKLRRMNLDVGDAQAVLSYCKKEQAENPNFFYAIQCDDDLHMINLFWVDARSRLAYQYFGDVITFDTTYKTNKYSMPFAPFTGLNHHRQSLLFGCALLQDESEESFVWLFQTWLQAMRGKHPVSIITDQDLAIGAAVARVFPSTRHRLCLWHIKKKFPEKLSQIYHKNSMFKRDLKRCIRDSPTIEEFENEWQHLMVSYHLEQNQWLQGLYNIRLSWIPVYNRNTFFAGMNTTQRSESINSFFDSFVNPTTTLHEFVQQYAQAVDRLYDKERREDFDSRYKSRLLKIESKIEHHAASTYTKTIFGMFQDELVKSNHFTREKIETSGTCCRYKVTNCFDSRDTFIVSLDLNSRVGKCQCQYFEFIGILCRHMLSIFQFENVVEIPSYYILPRWTKEANRGSTNGENKSSDKVDHHKSGMLRSMHVCHRTSQLTYLAEKNEEIYKVIISDLDQTLQKASLMESQMLINGENNNEMDSYQFQVGEQLCESQEHVSLNIGNPHVSQTKGRKKDTGRESHNKRFKSGLEMSLTRATTKIRACKVCKTNGHNSRTCGNKTND